MPEATTSSCFVVLPAGLILLDKGENALFEIDAELGHSLSWAAPVRQRPGLHRAAEQSARVNALILRELNVSQAELDALWTFVKTKRLRQRARLWRAKCGSGSVWPPRFG